MDIDESCTSTVAVIAIAAAGFVEEESKRGKRDPCGLSCGCYDGRYMGHSMPY